MVEFTVVYAVAVLPPKRGDSLSPAAFERALHDLIAEESIAIDREGDEIEAGEISVTAVEDEAPAGPYAPAIRRFTVRHAIDDRGPESGRRERVLRFLSETLAIGHYEDPWYIASVAVAGEAPVRRRHRPDA
jgi:hypothetical protein